MHDCSWRIDRFAPLLYSLYRRLSRDIANAYIIFIKRLSPTAVYRRNCDPRRVSWTWGGPECNICIRYLCHLAKWPTRPVK